MRAMTRTMVARRRRRRGRGKMDPSDHLRHQGRIREIILTANNRFDCNHCHSFTTNFLAIIWLHSLLLHLINPTSQPHSGNMKKTERGGMLKRKTTLINIMSPIVLFVLLSQLLVNSFMPLCLPEPHVSDNFFNQNK